MRSTRTLALAAMLLGSGCSSHLANFTVLSTRNVDLHLIDREKPALSQSEGSDSRFWFLFLPFGGSPSLETAANRCFDKANGNFLIDGAVYSEFTTFLIFTWEGYTVKGKVGKALQPANATPPR